MTKLREFLDTNGIKHCKFAETIGTSKFTMHSILNGVRYPTLELATTIEEKTMGAVTLYDWILKEKNFGNDKSKSKKKNQNHKK